MITITLYAPDGTKPFDKVKASRVDVDNGILKFQLTATKRVETTIPFLIEYEQDVATVHHDRTN